MAVPDINYQDGPHSAGLGFKGAAVPRPKLSDEDTVTDQEHR